MLITHSHSIKAERYDGKPRSELRGADFVLSAERKFPVMTAQDVSDAVSSWGRYRGPVSFESFKRRLIRLARRKGLVAALPDAWRAEMKEAHAHAHAYIEALELALKAERNYGARAGQTIVGNLKRGAGGRFERGSGAAASGRETIDALTKKPKGGKGKKRAPALGADALGSIGGDKADVDAINAFAKSGKIDTATADKLIAKGLAKRDESGRVVVSGAARTYARAVNRGDAAAAADALSRAEAGGKPKAPKPPKAPKGGGGGKADAAAKRDAERAQRAQQRQADEVRTVGNRLEEIETLTRQDTRVTEFERTQRLNRLEDLSVRLERAGGNDELAKRIEAARRTLETPTNKEARNTFAVFKQADGAWRWVARSSNAFRDRDAEIVSTKALETDTARMQEAGDYGPFRFWHMGDVGYVTPLDWRTSYAGAGLDIGAADFSAIDGRMLIESGTFKAGVPAEAIAANPDAWQVSIGFTHPSDEPDASGVYHNIRVFERSLLPRGKAANPFTGLSVNKDKKGQEDNMASLQDKWKEFVGLFGGDEGKAKEYATQTAETQKEIEVKGVAFKEGEIPAPEAQTPATEAKADGDAVAEDEAETESGFVGDMMADEFAALLTRSITEALAPMLQTQAELGKRIEGAETATKEVSNLAAKAGEMLIVTKQASDASIASIDARVKELEGDAPSASKGYRATRDDATVTKKQVQPPQTEDDIARLTAFMFSNQAEAQQ